MAALYWEANPSAGPLEIREMIVNDAVEGAIQDVGSDSPNLLLNTQALFTTPIKTPPSAARGGTGRLQHMTTLAVIGMLGLMN